MTATTSTLLPVINVSRLGIDAEAVGNNIGRAVVHLAQEHFHGLPPNKRGFPSTGFWRRAAEATNYELTRDGVQVSVDQVGVRQRLLGGRINPVNGKFLTIPAIAEAYGHRATEFDHLKVTRARCQTPFGIYSLLALVSADADTESGDPVDPSCVYYWLVSSVNQFPDPDVLPTTQEIAGAALNAIMETLK